MPPRDFNPLNTQNTNNKIKIQTITSARLIEDTASDPLLIRFWSASDPLLIRFSAFSSAPHPLLIRISSASHRIRFSSASASASYLLLIRITSASHSHRIRFSSASHPHISFSFASYPLLIRFHPLLIRILTRFRFFAHQLHTTIVHEC